MLRGLPRIVDLTAKEHNVSEAQPPQIRLGVTDGEEGDEERRNKQNQNGSELFHGDGLLDRHRFNSFPIISSATA
jgi:hypothetical protein